MEDKIKEIEKYFIDKILSNQFKIVDMSEAVFTILIDEKYSFAIWMEGPSRSRTLYPYGKQFMQLTFTDLQSVQLDDLLCDRYKKYHDGTLLKEKRKQFEQLKKELGEQ
jgi:hypothetical protein